MHKALSFKFWLLPIVVFCGLLVSPLNSAHASLTTVVNTIAQLRTMTSTLNDVVYLRGYYSPGDGGGGIFQYVNSYPYNVRIILGQLAVGAQRPDDGGRVIVPNQCLSATCKWVRVANGPINVKWFGAKGDGVTDDTTAINNALNDAYDRGGAEVYVEPTGHPYMITNTLNISNGVVLEGADTKNFPGMAASPTQWTANGSWIWVNANVTGITLSGHGAALKGINLMNMQGTSTSAWSSSNNNNSWMVAVTSDLFHIEDMIILNAPLGMIVQYPAGSGGGTYSFIRNIYFSCYKVGLQIDRVNDNLDVNNLHFRNIVNDADPTNTVEQYLLNNYYAMVIGYWDNPHVSGLDFYQAYAAMYFQNDTVSFGANGPPVTHSLKNGQFSNIQFNEVRSAMKVENASTDVSGQFSNVLLQGAAADFGINVTDTLFSLQSNAVDLHFSNLVLAHTGGALMELGQGTGTATAPSSFVGIDGLRVYDFSTLAPSPKPSLFIVYNNGSLTLGNSLIQNPTNTPVYSNYGSITYPATTTVPVLVPPPSAVLLGQTGQDYAGVTNLFPDGIKDVHIQLRGVSKAIKSILVGSIDGAWAYPFNGSNWIVDIVPESNPSIVDLFFDPYKIDTSYNITITYSDNTTATVVAQ